MIYFVRGTLVHYFLFWVDELEISDSSKMVITNDCICDWINNSELRLLFISIVIIFSLIVQTPEIARTTVSLKLIKPDSVCCIHSQYRSRRWTKKVWKYRPLGDRVWSILRVSIGFASLRIIGLPGEMAVTAFARWNSSIYVPSKMENVIILPKLDHIIKSNEITW